VSVIELLIQIAGVVLLFLVWVTEVALVRELRRGRESQSRIRAVMDRVEGALDALAEKLATIAGRLKL